MNKYAAYTQEVPGGWRVMLRYCRDSRPEPLKAKGGSPQIFPSQVDAYRALTENLLNFMNGRTIRAEQFETNATIRSARFESADKFFRKVDG